MGALLVGPCSPGWSHWEPEELFLQKAMRRTKEAGGPQLRLLRTAAPAVDPSRALLTIFPSSQEVSTITVEHMESVQDWAPLGWRHEADADGDPARVDHGSQLAAGSSRPRQLRAPGLEPAAPGARCKFWRARVTVEGPQGQPQTQWCLLQVAARVEDRTPEAVSQDIKDAAAVAKHAAAFNMGVLGHSLGGAGESMPVDDSAPQVRVAMPTGCRIVESPVPQHLCPGDEVVLLPYAAPEVTKFVYDGDEHFLELPQAFFHYTFWASGGAGCVADLQGAEEDDGSVVLVRPCPLRPAAPDAGGAFGSLGVLGAASTGEGATMDFFDRVHPRCGPLCKVFDPQRRARSSRKHCGLDVRGCGIRQL